jgi:hypothetical protein
LEIVKCTARSTDVLTVVRGQESTTARAFSTGDRIELRVTAAGITESANELIASGTLVIPGTSSSGAIIRLSEDTDNGTNYIGLKAPTSVASNKDFILPAADGTNGQFLKTDGSGNLGFASVVQKVVQTVVSTYKDAPTTTASSFTDVGWSASITPTSASNTIIVHAYISYSSSAYTNGGFNGNYFRLVDGSGNPIAVGNADGARQQVTFGGFAMYMGGNLMMKSMAFQWSPGSTSAQTIKLQWFRDGDTLILNRSFNANNVVSGNLSGLSTMVLMEIAP